MMRTAKMFQVDKKFVPVCQDDNIQSVKLANAMAANAGYARSIIADVMDGYADLPRVGITLVADLNTVPAMHGGTLYINPFNVYEEAYYIEIYNVVYSYLVSKKG